MTEAVTALAPLLRDSSLTARHARLRYAKGEEPGYSRRRRGSGFVYLDSRGRRVRDREILMRIRALAIPPAWTEVWISASPHSHIQATGRDARGRKQYRYHERFRALREAAKYAHIIRFGERLPLLRRRLRADLRAEGLPRQKVLAALVELMHRTCVRVGNDEYATANGSYGLTTLEDRHARIDGKAVTFKFKGKGGKVHRITLEDERLARIVKRCRDVPGQRLFQYELPEGGYARVTSGDLNEYLRQVTGEPFSAKDFRTWAGTLFALTTLSAEPPCSSKAEARRRVKNALEHVSAELGNTVAICRKSYVHPAVIQQFGSGELASSAKRARAASRRHPIRGMRPFESMALHWLRALSRERARGRRPERSSRRAGGPGVRRLEQRAGGALR